MLIIFEQKNGNKVALPVMQCAFEATGLKTTTAIMNENIFELEGSLEEVLTIIQRAVMMSQPQLQVPSFKSV